MRNEELKNEFENIGNIGNEKKNREG